MHFRLISFLVVKEERVNKLWYTIARQANQRGVKDNCNLEDRSLGEGIPISCGVEFVHN